ncbi:hypothetical protein BDBG_01731 [Blastomyces gilchristii SLH14081]|uniref:Uncharacterized protein n=1 Tax=Blastomyces gilchristii (strain SLH14081) TaxID=559298 RepID=A0A179UBI8_BLAGS|nr:uncharacterized protein BDBG_01731 [Blastomyces gilchristii SLH14081]EQL38825.1 hypothetical protein BDFG_00353 [Blastomyces dermatitidis ATCC 26199]OAT05314.1 hypothetical protein BDBG_01731 [Blastomyces gilchristii SLH14081]
MGNTQSTQPVHPHKSARRSNRLSKARTNHAGNRLRTTWDQELFLESPPLSSYSPYSPYSAHSSPSPWLDPQPVCSPELRPPIDEVIAVEPSSPASLHPSHASGSQCTGDDGRTRANFGEIMGEFKRRMSRSGSRTRGALFSHAPELDKLETRFSQPMPARVSSAQTEEPDRAFGLGVSTRDGFGPPESHRFPSIRRLSLYNPGKPVRSPKTLLQTIFSPRSTVQEGPAFSYWGRDGHAPMRRTSTDTLLLYEMTHSSPLRASTPSDLEYSHLGRLKLGSLRVVNGSASPAPSDRTPMSVRRQSFSDMKSVHLDQRNSTDLLRSRSRDWSDGYSSNSLPRAPHARSSHLEPSPSRLRTPRINRSKSPLRSEYGLSETPSCGKHDSGLPVFRLSWPKNAETFLGISSVPGSIKDQPLDFGASAGPSGEPNPALLTTSKANGFGDHLFENEDEKVVLTEKNEFVERECNVDLNRGRSVESYACNSTSRVKDQKTCPLTKADSGYSSASSNRSLRRHQLALTKGREGTDEATGQPNVISSGTTKAIEECIETSPSRPTSRRRSPSGMPPPVPRKDTPPASKTPNLHEHRSRYEEVDRARPLTVQANASFSQRMAHIGSSILAPPVTPILSPTPLDKGFHSFLSEAIPETEQSSWLWSPDPSQHDPLKNLEADYVTPTENQVNEHTVPIHRSTSVQNKKSTDFANLSHPYPLQAHRLHRPQSMVNLNESTSNLKMDHQPHRQQHQRQEQEQQQSRSGVRNSFFRHRNRSKKRNTVPGDRTSFFGHKLTRSKPATNNPTSPTTATESAPRHRNLPISNLDRELPPTPAPGPEHESVILGDTPPSRRVDSSGNRCPDYNNYNIDDGTEYNRSPSIFTGPFPLQNSKRVKPKRSFVRGVEGRRNPFFCVGLPQSQSQPQPQ